MTVWDRVPAPEFLGQGPYRTRVGGVGKVLCGKRNTRKSASFSCARRRSNTSWSLGQWRSARVPPPAPASCSANREVCSQTSFNSHSQSEDGDVLIDQSPGTAFPGDVFGGTACFQLFRGNRGRSSAVLVRAPPEMRTASLSPRRKWLWLQSRGAHAAIRSPSDESRSL